MSTANTLRTLTVAISICAVLLSTSVRADDDDEDDEDDGGGRYYSQQVDPGYGYQQPVYQPNYGYRSPSSYQPSAYPRPMMQDGYGNPMNYGAPNVPSIQMIEGMLVGLLSGR